MLGPDQLQEYLEHVQLSGEALRPSLATLVTLHRQHAKCIPFSNITIAQGPTLLKDLKFPHEIPDISPDGLIEKLLRRKWYDDNLLLAIACFHEAHRFCLGSALMIDLKMSLKCRGGYCFESNGLLAEALVGLGFEVYCVAGRNLIESPRCKSKLQVRLCRASHGTSALCVTECP